VKLKFIFVKSMPLIFGSTLRVIDGKMPDKSYPLNIWCDQVSYPEHI
jgi:hypothetical protein